MSLRAWSIVCIIALVGSMLLVGCPKQTAPDPAINQPPVELPQPPAEEQTAEETTRQSRSSGPRNSRGMNGPPSIRYPTGRSRE